MAFIEPMHRNKPNITYLLIKMMQCNNIIRTSIFPKIVKLDTP